MSVRPHTEHLLQIPGRYPGRTNPVGRRAPSRPPTAFELITDPVVTAALERAWAETVADAPVRRERGGWVYINTTTGRLSVVTAPVGTSAEIQLGFPPPVPGSVVVATFHTHPNPAAPGPSQPRDIALAWDRGVPGIIRSANGVHVYGLEARRGDWRTASRSPGFPNG